MIVGVSYAEIPKGFTVKAEEPVCRGVTIGMPRDGEAITTIQVLILMPEDVVDMALLSGATNLRVLRVYGADLQDIAALGSLSCLEEIALEDCDLREIDWIKSLVSLKHVSLAHNHIQSVEPLTLLPQLQFLNLSNNNIREVNSSSAFITSLVHLDLRDNPLDIDALCKLESLFEEHNRCLLTGNRKANTLTTEQIIAAKALVSRHCLRQQLTLFDKMAAPQFDRVPDSVVTAIQELTNSQEGGGLADLAIDIIKLIEMSVANGYWGPFAEVYYRRDAKIALMPPGIKCVQAQPPDGLLWQFLMQIDYVGQVIPLDLTKWVVEHRCILGPSLLLDEAIKELKPKLGRAGLRSTDAGKD
jgi:hypothetical protein